jgi:hypothetical protein
MVRLLHLRIIPREETRIQNVQKRTQPGASLGYPTGVLRSPARNENCLAGLEVEWVRYDALAGALATSRR